MALIKAARGAQLEFKPSLQVAIALEFSAGACNALDEYTLFLTPGYYNDVQAMVQGKFVSIGVDLGPTADGQIEIVRVYPKSPAADAGLLPGDRILAVNREGDLTPEQAADKLRGEAGSAVEIEFLRAGRKDSVKVARQPVFLPSVSEPLVLNVSTEMGTIPVGYIQINHFQDSTVQDVKEALAQLQTAGVKALILDLRGNPGGAFKAGLQTAELFLNEGVIVYSQSPLADFNRPFKVEARNPVTLPVVVLVDRDTASRRRGRGRRPEGASPRQHPDRRPNDVRQRLHPGGDPAGQAAPGQGARRNSHHDRQAVVARRTPVHRPRRDARRPRRSGRRRGDERRAGGGGATAQERRNESRHDDAIAVRILTSRDR